MDGTLAALGLAVKRLQWRHEREAGIRLAAIGVSLPQWNLLRQVARNPTSSLRDLATVTFQTEQGVGAMAVRMTDKGMLARAEGGGRAVHLVLTSLGQRLLREGSEIMEEMLAVSFGGLDVRQREQLLALLEVALAG